LIPPPARWAALLGPLLIPIGDFFYDVAILSRHLFRHSKLSIHSWMRYTFQYACSICWCVLLHVLGSPWSVRPSWSHQERRVLDSTISLPGPPRRS